MSPRDRAPAALFLTVFLVNWGLITHGTFAGSGDEPHYMLIAHSLAFDRDLDVANNYREATLITSGTLLPDAHVRAIGPYLRPVHDVGMPILFAPAVAAAYRAAEAAADAVPASVLQKARLTPQLIFRHQLSLLMALVAGLLAMELFALFRVSGSPTFAGAAALVVTLSPPILSHSFLFFTEIVTATITVAMFRRLMSGETRRGALVIVGVATGLLFLIHARNIGLVAGLCALMAWSFRRGDIGRAQAVGFLAGVVAALVLRTWINYTLWGQLMTTPHAALGWPGGVTAMLAEIWIRAAGLLIDREFGLLAYAPIYLCALAGAVLMLRARQPIVAIAALALAAAYLLPVLLPVTNMHGWTGGWSPAARFLVPIVPLLAIAGYTWATAAPRWLLGTLAAAQIAINIFVWQNPKTLWNDGDGVSAFAPANLLPSLATPPVGIWPVVLICGLAVVAVVMVRVVGTTRVSGTISSRAPASG